MNDSRALLRSGCPAPAPRCDNCAFVELHLQGWPVIALITTAPVSLGEELLASHGSQYWDYVKDAQGRLNQVLKRTGIADAAVMIAPAAPAAEMVSEVFDETAAAPAGADASVSRHELQVDGKAKCAVVLTAPQGAALLPFPAAAALNVTTKTFGDNAAASIKPLLASGAWDGQPLLVTGATPADVAKLASVAATLDKKGKAALVTDCDGGTQADPGRRLYLLPAGRVADSVLGDLPTAALASSPGSLIALIFAPARRVAAPASAPAPAEQAGTALADHAPKQPAPAPAPLAAAGPEVVAGREGFWYCPTCSEINGPTYAFPCHRCHFLPAAVPVAQQPPMSSADINMLKAYLGSVVTVLSSAKPESLPMCIPRLSALVFQERTGTFVPASVACRFGTLLALLQAHDDIFAVELSADNDPRTPGRVRLRAPATPPAPLVWAPPLPPSHPPMAMPLRPLPPRGAAADPWACPTCDLSHLDRIRFCDRCKWQRAATPAAVQALQYNSAAETAAQDEYAEAVVTLMRGGSIAGKYNYTVRALSAGVWVYLRVNVPESAVARYGTLSAFLAARPGVFRFVPPAASIHVAPAPPYSMVALTDGALDGSVAPADAALLPPPGPYGLAAALPAPAWEPPSPPSHPPWPSSHVPPLHDGTADALWTCPTCDVQIPERFKTKNCKKCMWLCEPTSAAVQTSTHNSAAAVAAQDRYAAAIIAVLRASATGKLALRSLSYSVFRHVQAHAPDSAVRRYGMLAAFVAARPADFRFLPARQGRPGAAPGSFAPAYEMVALTADGGHAASTAPPALALPPPQSLPPASNQVLSAAHLTSLLLQLKRAAEGGELPPAKAARFEDAPRRS